MYQINTIPPFTGIGFVEWPATGKMKEKVEYKDGILDGKVQEWDERGSKLYEATFVAGKQTGVETHWHPGGKKTVETTYLNDVMHGKLTQWHLNEEVAFSGEFSQGERTGKHTWYHENGKKASEGMYKNGEPTGTHTWWYASGQKEQEVPYTNGKVNGVLKGWHTNGKKRLEQSFKSGQQDGVTKEWFLEGGQMLEEVYVSGQQTGLQQLWDKQGRLIEENDFQNGEITATRNYRSASFRTTYGFVQVFNERETSFLTRLKFPDIRPLSTRELKYIVDSKLLQLGNLPFSQMTGSDEGTLPGFVAKQMKDVETDLDASIAYETESLKTRSGDEVYYWWFEQPKAETSPKGRSIKEQHFMAMVVGDQIFYANTIVTNLDSPEGVKEMLIKVLNEVEESDELIELNQLLEKEL